MVHKDIHHGKERKGHFMWLLQGQNQQETSSTVVSQQSGDTYRPGAFSWDALSAFSVCIHREEGKKNQDWCSLLLLLLKFKAPFSHCSKDSLIPLQQEAISPVFPLG